jgi:hypothetical protein
LAFFLGDPCPQFFWISFAQDFNATPLGLSSTHPVSLTFTPQNCGFHGLDFSGSVNICKNFSLSINPSLFGLLQGKATPLLHNHHSLPHL